MSKLRIGYFTDSHLREKAPGTSGSERRQCRLMKTRLEECVETWRVAEVDLIVGTGDTIDDATQPEAPEDLAIVRNILDRLAVPKIMIPGNHDPYPGVFYEVFDRPSFLTVMGRYQFLSFLDYCEPGDNASERDERSIERMSKALTYNPKDVAMTVALQHYEIYPEGLTGYPYNYKNAATIRKAMQKSKAKILSVSGHYHRGIPLTEHKGVTYFVGKALCEEPFPCYVIELDGQDVRIRQIDRAG